VADVLFVLAPDFADPAAGPGAFYCPGCATVSGLLGYFPQLRATLDVRTVGFSRPRAEVAALLGPDHPGCPVLVLDAAAPVPEGVPVHAAPTGRRYVLGANDIGRYLAVTRGVSSPHP